MITVHHLNNSRSQRVLWLLEELGLPYEVAAMSASRTCWRRGSCGDPPARQIARDHRQWQHHRRDRRDQRIHSRHLWQWPPDPAAGTDERLRYTYWLHYAEGSAMTPLLLKLVFTRMPMSAPPCCGGSWQDLATGADHAGRPADQAARRFLGSELTKAEWFAGKDFTAADIMMSFPLEAPRRNGARRQIARPMVKAFLDKIHARPAYQAALKTGGPYVVGR